MERFSERVKRYVDLVRQFKYQQTFNEFYDEDLTRIHNVGKWTLDAFDYKARIQSFLDKAENRKIEIKNVIVNERMQMSIIEYRYSLDHKEKGHIEIGQVTVQKWQDGRILFEKIYSTGTHVTEQSDVAKNATSIVRDKVAA